MSQKLEIYTDGACLDNPGPGGWGAVLLPAGEVKKISGSVHDTTSQQMELLAAAKGLEAAEVENIALYTDSAYLVNAFRQNWLDSWKNNDWQRSKGPLKNKFLWLWLDTLTNKHKVEFKKVKGHSGVKWNEEVDDLAREAAKKIAGKQSYRSTTSSTSKTKSNSTAQNTDYKYETQLRKKAEEFIELLEENNFQSRVVDVFEYQITISLATGKMNYGNLRIYYKPSKDSYSLGLQELQEMIIADEVKKLWSQL